MRGKECVDVYKRQALDVSADYILGLKPVQKRRNMDIVATGLSEESVRRLIHRTADEMCIRDRSRAARPSRFPSTGIRT